jgi:osmotically-inducible protein OsmY
MKVKNKKTAKRKLRDRFKGQPEWNSFRTSTGIGVGTKDAIKPNVSSIDVKNKIAEAWRRSAVVNADRFVVNVHDGTVEVWGGVRSWSEMVEADRVLGAVPGVTKVDNHLCIVR